VRVHLFILSQCAVIRHLSRLDSQSWQFPSYPVNFAV
jgi:hypothetical protein